MPVLLAAKVQRCPCAVPVEGNVVVLAVTVVLFLEGVEVDQASLLVCEKLERNIIFGVGLRKEVVEDGPVMDVDAIFLVTVGNGEEDCVLLALDFMLFKTMFCQSMAHNSLCDKYTGTTKSISTYIVFASRRNSIDKFLLAHQQLSSLSILLCILIECRPRLC